MKVAINTRLLLTRPEGIGNYILETVTRMAINNPLDEFHLLFDRPFREDWLIHDNLYGHVLRPSTRHPLLWKFWFEYRLPGFLKMISADCFLSPEGMLSLRSNIPSVMTIHDLAYLEYPDGSIRSHKNFLHKYMPRFIEKANRIICVSATTKKSLDTHFPEHSNKSVVILNGVNERFQPIAETEKHEFRKKYTRGRPYILYLGSLHPRKNIVHLIEAFEQFKFECNGDYVLVLAGRLAWKSNKIKQKLNESKVRSDIIHLTDYENYITSLYGAASIFCYPSFFEGFGLPVLEAMSCGVPVLTSKNSSMQEVCQSAAVYFDPQSVGDMANQLKVLANNGTLQRKMIEQGMDRSKKFSWNNTAGLLYNELHSLAKK